MLKQEHRTRWYPCQILKDGSCVFKIPVTYIVDLSTSESKVPESDEMKLARVKPLYKKNYSV